MEVNKNIFNERSINTSSVNCVDTFPSSLRRGRLKDAPTKRILFYRRPMVAPTRFYAPIKRDVEAPSSTMEYLLFTFSHTGWGKFVFWAKKSQRISLGFLCYSYLSVFVLSAIVLTSPTTPCRSLGIITFVALPSETFSIASSFLRVK